MVFISCSEAPHNVSLSSDIDFNVAYLGDIVTLLCSSSGGPNNMFKWMKEEVVISDETKETLTLNITSIYYGGTYTCSVNNTAGNDSASATLYVAPYFINPLVSTLEKQVLSANGSSLEINCDATGFPTPTVNWVDMTSMEVYNTSLLEFTPVIFGDEGLYYCVATTEIEGKNFTSTVEITLVG